MWRCVRVGVPEDFRFWLGVVGAHLLLASNRSNRLHFGLCHCQKTTTARVLVQPGHTDRQTRKTGIDWYGQPHIALEYYIAYSGHTQPWQGKQYYAEKKLSVFRRKLNSTVQFICLANTASWMWQLDIDGGYTEASTRLWKQVLQEDAWHIIQRA